ncbi:hypothetical protein LPB41_30660 [Thalassospira sp. MA62]|nr:hypothetical protein [Thalassospira sp. MA62]
MSHPTGKKATIWRGLQNHVSDNRICFARNCKGQRVGLGVVNGWQAGGVMLFG